MRFDVLKADRRGFAGQLPEWALLGVPLGPRSKFDFCLFGFGRGGGELGVPSAQPRLRMVLVNLGQNLLKVSVALARCHRFKKSQDSQRHILPDSPKTFQRNPLYFLNPGTKDGVHDNFVCILAI